MINDIYISKIIEDIDKLDNNKDKINKLLELESEVRMLLVDLQYIDKNWIDDKEKEHYSDPDFNFFSENKTLEKLLNNFSRAIIRQEYDYGLGELKPNYVYKEFKKQLEDSLVAIEKKISSLSNEKIINNKLSGKIKKRFFQKSKTYLDKLATDLVTNNYLQIEDKSNFKDLFSFDPNRTEYYIDRKILWKGTQILLVYLFWKLIFTESRFLSDDFFDRKKGGYSFLSKVFYVEDNSNLNPKTLQKYGDEIQEILKDDNMNKNKPEEKMFIKIIVESLDKMSMGDTR